jgi:hypothetical protein
MHCIELAELASLLAHQTPGLFAMRTTLREDSLTRYWVQSRQRLYKWHDGLVQYTSLENAGRSLAIGEWWKNHEAMLEEILVSEILVRVFAAMGAGLDHVKSQREVEPVTHSVFVSHLEARNRVLQLLLFGRGGSVIQTVQLNRLRRACERWTDRLLAPIISKHFRAKIYAFDIPRAIVYANEYHAETDANTRTTAAWLGHAAMRSVLESRVGAVVASPLANREVSQSILACLPADCFDSLGVMRNASSLRWKPVGTEGQPHAGRPLFPCSLPSEHLQGALPSSARWLL